MLTADADRSKIDACKPHSHELPGWPGACATVSGAADDEEAAPGGFGGREKRSGFARWWDLKMDAICLGRI